MAAFTPALIVVDLQEDFCPPNGSLAVQDGRSITPIINTLLRLPFALKIATRDWHPPNHVSFAATHRNSSPYTSTYTITQHPSSSSSVPRRQYTTTLWPTHCVAHTPGAQLIPELDAARLHRVLDKGTRVDREMYSAFWDPFGESDSGLAGLLRDAGVTDVYVVGLAFDYCVRATAEHAAEAGFTTVVLEDATKAVFPDTWNNVVAELQSKNVHVVSSTSSEVQKVESLFTSR
ncbi:Nicotinamidase [Beauveria bassiana D1-5]|uniref:nicotinamidase n=1 Tax=Beauveria bassiana D1-5 TaxID=1245745 RepID=A0A0A2W416_BEABA|nr:Nicotinamidase [Beauveria bassiana D1-5]